jgi:predicted RNase H-like HicB family nuclease
MRYNVNVIYEKDEHGYYVYCPQLAGCHSQGDTFEEARENIQEAIELYLETMAADEIAETLGHELITSTIEVAVA